MKQAENFIWNTIPRVLQYGTSLVTSVFLARLLTPEDYGLVALANVFFVILNIFVWDGLGNGLVQRKESDELDFSSVLIFNFVLAIAIYLLLFLSAPVISKFCGYSDILTSILRVLALRIIISSIISIQYAYISRNLIFEKKIIPSTLGSTLSGALGILLAFLGYGVWALVYQYLLASIIEVVALYYALSWHPEFRFMFRRIKPILKFSWKILVEALVSNLTVQIRSLLIGKSYSPADLGLYAKGQQFPSLMSNCFCVPLNATLFPMISNIKESRDEVLVLLRSVVRMSSFLLVPIFFYMCSNCEEWVRILLTDRWVQIIPFIWIFSATHLFDIANHTKNAALNGIGKSSVFMTTNGIIKSFDVILMLICLRFGTLSVALSTTVTNFILFLAVSFNSRKYLTYSFKNQIKDILPTVLFSAIATVCCVYLKVGLNGNLLLIFFIKTMFFWAVYLGLAFLTKQNELYSLINSINKKTREQKY